jgi:hypothetical protein
MANYGLAMTQLERANSTSSITRSHKLQPNDSGYDSTKTDTMRKMKRLMTLNDLDLKWLMDRSEKKGKKKKSVAPKKRVLGDVREATFTAPTQSSLRRHSITSVHTIKRNNKVFPS